MNEGHDTWMDDSAQQMVGLPSAKLVAAPTQLDSLHNHRPAQDTQDPNAWLHERLDASSSSNAQNGFEQSPYVASNGFDQHATNAQSSFYTTFHVDPINQHQQLPPRPHINGQTSSYNGTNGSYSVPSEGVANGNGAADGGICSQPTNLSYNGSITVASASTSSSLNTSTFYNTPYQTSPPTAQSYTYGQPPSTTTNDAPRTNFHSQPSYMSSWATLAARSSNTPPVPASNDTAQQITIDPSLVSITSTPPAPSRSPLNGYIPSQANPYSSTITPTSLHNALGQPYYTKPPQIVPPPTPQISTGSQQQPQPQQVQIAPSKRATPKTQAKAPGRSSTNSPSVQPESFLRRLLSPDAMENDPTGSARSLINALKGMPDVSSPLRKEILNMMRDNAGKDYFEAWAKNADGMEIVRAWLKVATTRKDTPSGKRETEETLMPLLNVIDRLPLGIDELRAAKIGKLVKSIVTDPPSSAAKDLATVLTQKWTKLINQEHKKSNEDDAGPSDPKKRKSADTPGSKAPPAKKPTPPASTAPSSTVVKKEATAKAESAKATTAKSDSSFFSAPKKKVLPSFKKVTAPGGAKKEEGTAVAQPSNFDPYQEAFLAITKAATLGGQSSTSTPPAAADGSEAMVVDAVDGPKKDNLRKKKSVTFRPDEQLEAIRWITKADYGDEEGESSYGVGDVRSLDRDEGRALHHQMFEETIDWYDPTELEMPDSITLDPRGRDSEEAKEQEEREKTALVASYMSMSHVPESASDIHPRLGEPGPNDTPPIEMLPGPDIAEILAQEENANAPQLSVNELLAQIGPPTQPKAMVNEMWGQQSFNPQQQAALNGLAGTSAADISALLSNIPKEALSFLQQAQQQQQPGPPAGYGADSGYGGQQGFGYDDQSQQYWNESGGSGGWTGGGDDWDSYDSRRGRGRGGRGRGRGRGRGTGGGANNRPACTYWGKGFCRFGEACDFYHDPALASLQRKR